MKIVIGGAAAFGARDQVSRHIATMRSPTPKRTLKSENWMAPEMESFLLSVSLAQVLSRYDPEMQAVAGESGSFLRLLTCDEHWRPPFGGLTQGGTSESRVCRFREFGKWLGQ